MSEKEKSTYTADDAEISIKLRLRELEACEYLIQHIVRVVDNHNDAELHNTAHKLTTYVLRSKDRAWQNLAMLAPINKNAMKALELRLRHMIDRPIMSLEEFMRHEWRHNATSEGEFREYVKKLLADALMVREEPLQSIQVPKRELTPDL